MITTAQKIMDAANALRSLTSIALPYRKARELKIFKDWLVKESEIVMQTQLDLVKKYGGSVSNDGSVLFSDKKTSQNFVEDMTAQFREEIELDAPACNLSEYVDSFTMSADAVGALDGFIVFDEAADSQTE